MTSVMGGYVIEYAEPDYPEQPSPSLPCEDKPDDWFGGPEVADQGRGKKSRKESDELEALMSLSSSVCWQECPHRAREACFELGMREENLHHGVWGGWTPKQRLGLYAHTKGQKSA